MTHKRSTTIPLAVLFIMAGICICSPIMAGDTVFLEQERLVAESPGEDDLFGFTVAANQRWLAVSAKMTATDVGDDAGVVHLYQRRGDTGRWTFYQTIYVKDGGPADEFGSSLAIRGNLIAVGARFASNSNGNYSGVVYLFKWRGHKHGWRQVSKVWPEDGLDDDEFGRSVALGPGSLVVGARFGDSDLLEDTGAVYIYKRYGKSGQWAFKQKLNEDTLGVGDEFGRAISLDPMTGRLLAVGSRWTDETGAVFVYEKRRRQGGWTLTETLKDPEGQKGDRFGQSVVIRPHLLVVGIRDADVQEGEADAGVVKVYRRAGCRGTWELEQILTAEDGKKKDQFGFNLAVDALFGEKIAVGSRRADLGEIKDTGAVFVFGYDSETRQWGLIQTLAPKDLHEDAEYGQCLAMDPLFGRWLVVGADQFQTSGLENSGAVFTYGVED